MAYNRPANLASGATVTEAWFDSVTDSFEAGFPDIATAAGDMVYATAADTGVRLGIGAADDFLVAGVSGPEWQKAPAARVYNDATIAIGVGVYTSLTFNQERYDTDSCHSVANNTSRLTVPANGNGLYHIGGCVKMDMPETAGDSFTGLRIYLNGSTNIAVREDMVAKDMDAIWTVSCDYLLSATDYVELQFYSGGGYDIIVGSNYSPEFWFHWFRRQ